MAKISVPGSHADLPIDPSLPGQLPISEMVQQVLAMLVGSTQDATQFLKVSPSGILSVSSSRLKDIVHFTGVGANDTQQGPNVPCTEVLVMGHPLNTGTIWVRSDKIATVNNAWPLDKKEAISIVLDNLNQLQLLIETGGEKAIVAYTR